jgi:hypothetical protein
MTPRENEGRSASVAQRSAELSRRQWRQIGVITLGAVVLFVVVRRLPTGTNLSHMDFRASGTNVIEFCDPANPQFIPVVDVRSPVTMRLTSTSAVEGTEFRGVFTLKTSSGKPVAPEDLIVMHTKKLHLMIVDPTLTDYQHVHPEPGTSPGEWSFAFTPRAGGTYRLFADFTPTATGRGLYASVDLPVEATPRTNPTVAAPAEDRPTTEVQRDGFRFRLVPMAPPIRAGQPADLRFTIERTGGGLVPLETVMGAFAHLVAFDEARRGFAHLHPMEADPTKRPDAEHPALSFRITIPSAGRYVIWSQVNLGGREAFVPFWFNVAP